MIALTPEKEAYRLERLRAALKGKPATEEQRIKRAEGLRKAWADGRIKPSATPASIAKTAAFNRGKTRPAHVIEAVKKFHTGRKRTPEQVERMKIAHAAARAAGKGKPSPEGIERRRAATIAALTGRKQTPERIEKHAAILRGRKAKPEHIEKRIAPMIGRPQTAPCNAKGPNHQGASEGVLRDAKGRIWFFKNMCFFVETHPELFDEKDLRLVGNKRNKRPYAAKRLCGLFGHGKVVPGSWKGWTAATTGIDRAQGFADILSRDISQVVA